MAKPEPLLLSKARKSAVELEALRSLVVPMANSAIANQSNCAETLFQLGEQCRQIGELDVAARVYSRLKTIAPDHADASRLCDVLSGNTQNTNRVMAGPVPFLQIQNFLNAETHNSLISKAITDLGLFEEAKVYSTEGVSAKSNRNLRRGKLLAQEHVAPYAETFLPFLKQFVRDKTLLSKLGKPESLDLRYELQVTNYCDGEFFARHVDDGSPQLRNRVVSYVYYMRRNSSSFDGGDLILYDERNNHDTQKPVRYTRIRPTNNSIVFFQSSGLHEVEPTFVASGDREDGRFSINGWLISA